MIPKAGLPAIVAALLLAPPSVAAPPADRDLPTPGLIERAVDRGEVSRDDGRLHLANALRRPERLPARFRSDVRWDGTLPLLRLRHELTRMPRGQKRRQIEEAVGPTPSAGGDDCSGAINNPQVTNTTNFYVEYTGTFGDGLTLGDYSSALESSWTKETDDAQFNWARPPVKNAVVQPRYHVQIDDLGTGLYGFVTPSGTHAGLVGDNPDTPWNEGDSYASCMVVNQDMPGGASTALPGLRATAAHELNHSIQFGYGALDATQPFNDEPDALFSEGGATWMEDEVFDDANDNYFYLDLPSSDPDFGDSLGTHSDDGSEPYAGWLILRAITERFGAGNPGGGEQVMQDFWELVSGRSGSGQRQLTPLENAVAAKGGGITLGQAYHDAAAATWFLRGCGGGFSLPYCFAEASGYGDRPTAHGSIGSVGGSLTQSIEDNYATRWISLPAGGPYDVTVQNTSSAGMLKATAGCRNASSLTLKSAPGTIAAGQASTVPSFAPGAACSEPVAVVTTVSKTADKPSSDVTRSFNLSVTAPGGTPPPPPPTQHTLTVSKAGIGSGSVTSSPTGIDCGSDCSQSYAAGTAVTLTAVQTSGSTFSGWGGACSGTGSCVVTMNGARGVTASFSVASSPPPPPPGGSGGTTGATPFPALVTPAPTLSDPLPDLTAPRLGISRRTIRTRRGRARVRLSCPAAEPGGCRGRVRILGRAGARTRSLGGARFSRFAGGRSKVVSVRLTRLARRLLRRSGRLRVRVRVRVADDAGNARTLSGRRRMR